MKKSIEQKHLLPETSYRDYGYINEQLVDYGRSYYSRSKPNNYGMALIYQFVVMLDGTTYHLISRSNYSKGLIPNNCHKSDATQKEILNIALDAIEY